MPWPCHRRAGGGADPISAVLRSEQLRGALFFAVAAPSPRCVDIPPADRCAASILPPSRRLVPHRVAVDGDGPASVPGGERLAFAAGEVIVFMHGDADLMSSEPGAPPELDAEPTLGCCRQMAAGRLPCPIRDGGGPSRARFIGGFLGCDAGPFNPPLAAWARLLPVQGFAGDRGAIDQLLEPALREGRERRAGAECMKLALSEIRFIEAIRRHLVGHAINASGRHAGLADPAVGRALALLHARSAERWSLDRLAREAGISRTVPAERVITLVGLSPRRCPAA